MFFTRWSDFDRDFAALDALRRRVEEVVRDLDQPFGARRRVLETAWPRTNLYDTGPELVLHAAVPGLHEEELQINATGDVVTVTGERKVEVPEGYSAHRQERGYVRFSRSFTLPVKVVHEKTSATVKDGMLTVRMSKAPEAQPRQITIKASA